jgi:ABC-2 type transport system permease protein
VGYFVYALVLPTISEVLAANAQWFQDARAWVDFNYAQTALFNGSMTAEQWSQLGVTSVIWLIAPLALGVALVLRSEVK